MTLPGAPEPPPDRAWLDAERARLLAFAAGSVHQDGGFAWLDDDGHPRLDRPVETWITARMTHVFALGQLLGHERYEPLVRHGVRALRGRLRDARHGGWFAAVDGRGPSSTDKRAYEHAFVLLAAASGVAAGAAGADRLLDEALDVWTRRFWRERDGLCVDVWDRSWSVLEPYRGANANMHTVEALLAVADVTGEDALRQRALRIAERVVHGWAREHGWRLPEHFDERWRPLLDYNGDQPAHPFRPYGVTVGHLLEWARLCLHVQAALGAAAPDWLVGDAIALFDRAVRDGWAVDGRPGFVYTVGWDGAPVVRDRLHWVLAEAIAAAAALGRVTSDPAYETWYRLWWQHAMDLFVDPDRGSWRHELDATNSPASNVWQGKPDVYHAVQATLIPLLPLAPTFAEALRTHP